MTVLLDGNVLVALTVQDHIQHATVVDWFAIDEREFATTPTTQGTLLRFLLRAGLDSPAALEVLDGIVSSMFATSSGPTMRRTMP